MNKFIALFAAVFCLLAVFTVARPFNPYAIDSLMEELDEYELQASGSDVVNFALGKVGTKYVYGGTSFSTGIDCSGFVQACYAHVGVSLPRTSGDQCSRGTAVTGGQSNWKAGDVLCFPGHVAIYQGNGRIVHAANTNRGVVQDPVYATPSSVRRFL